MFSKIHVGKIISHQNSTLSDDTGKANFGDYVTFYLLPLLMALAWVLVGGKLSAASISVIVTASSIFAGLMFSLLILTHERRVSTKKPNVGEEDFDERSHKIKLTEETYYNISFAILIAISCTFLCIIYIAISELTPKNNFSTLIHQTITQIVGAGIISTIICTLSSLLMVLKRSFSMFIHLDKNT